MERESISQLESKTNNSEVLKTGALLIYAGAKYIIDSTIKGLQYALFFTLEIPYGRMYTTSDSLTKIRTIKQIKKARETLGNVNNKYP
jgi:hypothetical protein